MWTRILSMARGIVRWFLPGLGVKRWFLFVLFGISLLGLGFAVILIEVYRTDSTNPILLTLLAYASLRFLPRFIRAMIFAALGIALVAYGIVRLNRSLLAPFLRPGSNVVDQIREFRRRQAGTRVVAFGRGDRLSRLLLGSTS